MLGSSHSKNIFSNIYQRVFPERITIEDQVQKLTANTKVINTIASFKPQRAHDTVKKKDDAAQYSDDWDSDYSDDWEADPDNTLKPSDLEAFHTSFCRKRQAAIDNMSYREAVNSWKSKLLHDIVKLINDLSAGKSVIDRAWIIFYWVSQNIEYDVEAYFSGKITHQTSNDIFASGKGVCDAFGTVFETLCNAVKIECKKIGGYAKGYSYKIGQKSLGRANHAWNVIHLEGHWYLVDPTWGEGFLDENKCNQKRLDPFFFLVPPEQMIYTHFPDNAKWQLLRSPVSMNDFLRLPRVHSTFFDLHLDIVHPYRSSEVSFDTNREFAEVLIRAPADVSLMNSIEQEGSGKIKNGDFVQYDHDRQLWQCLFAPKSNGFHTLTVYARRKKQRSVNEIDEGSYNNAIKLGLQVTSNLTKSVTFPLTYGLFIEHKCQIFEPLTGVLKSGSKVTIHCRIPGARRARLTLDGNWLSEDSLKDGILKKQITVPRKEVIVYVKFAHQENTSHYDGLIRYSVM